MLIRDPLPTDQAAWTRLWGDYNMSQDGVVPEAVTRHTWARILDPDSPIFARLAERDGAVIGFSVNVLHEGTWTLAPICYLEDLFVDAAHRGQGAGRLLIEDLVERSRLYGWSRLYWHARAANPARRLYERFVAADEYVRYRMYIE